MLKRSLRSRRVVPAGCGLVATTYGVARYGLGLQLPQLSAAFDLEAGTAGALAAGSYGAYCVAALVARRAIGRSGARPALWLAATLAAVGSLVVATATALPALAVGVLVAGSAAGAASPVLVVAVHAAVPGAREPRAQAMVNAGTGLGVLVAGATVLVAPDAWRPLWVGAAVAAVATAVVVDRSTPWPAPPGAGTGTGTGTGEGRGGRTATAGPLVAPVLLALAAGAGSAAVWTFGRDLVVTTGGLDPRTGAALWMLLGASAVLGAVSGDVVRLAGLRAAWSATAGATAVGTAVLAVAPGSMPLAALGCALFGGAYTAVSGVLIAWAVTLRPTAAGSLTATLFVALTAGQALGAAALGVLAEAAGQRAAFAAGAALLVLAAAAVPPRQRRHVAP